MIERKTEKAPVVEWRVKTDEPNGNPHIATIKILDGGNFGRPVRVISYWANSEDTGGWYPSEVRLFGEALIEAADAAEKRFK